MGCVPQVSVGDQFITGITLQAPTSRGGRKAPTMTAAHFAIMDIYTLLHPKRHTGPGHKTHGLQPFVMQHLQDMSIFLHLYTHGTQEWTNSSLAVVKIFG